MSLCSKQTKTTSGKHIYGIKGTDRRNIRFVCYETDTPEPTEVLYAAATQESWVYLLKNSKITKELEQNKLAVSSTLRKRLVSFLRRINTNLARKPLGELAQTTMTSLPAVTLEPIKTHDWKVFFGNRDDPIAFLERLYEICAAKGIDKDRLLPCLPELLSGDPALWFRSNRVSWNTWEDFETSFRTLFFSINYQTDLEIEISRRLQRRNESVTSAISKRENPLQDI